MPIANVATVTVEQLAFAYDLAGNAGANRIPQAGVGGKGVTIDMGDGKMERIEFAETPMNRAMFAVRDNLPRELFQPVMYRIWALSAMLQLPEAQAYIRPVEGEQGESEFSEALFKVAAVMPLNAKLEFNRNTFFKRVAAEFAKAPD